MTTTSPFGATPFFSMNVTTSGERDSLYRSSGAIIAAIVVVVIIVLTVVLLLLKKYNSSRPDTRRFTTSPYATGASQAAAPVLELRETESEKMRARQGLELKHLKSSSSSALGPKGRTGQHSATVTFSPDDIQMEPR